jgi:hypothetical protein
LRDRTVDEVIEAGWIRIKLAVEDADKSAIAALLRQRSWFGLAVIDSDGSSATGSIANCYPSRVRVTVLSPTIEQSKVLGETLRPVMNRHHWSRRRHRPE